MIEEIDEHLKDDFKKIKDNLIEQIEQWDYGKYLHDLRIDKVKGFRVASEIEVNKEEKIMLYGEVEASFRVKLPYFFNPKLPIYSLNFEIQLIIVSYFSINKGKYKLEVVKLAKNTPQDSLEGVEPVKNL